MPKKRSRGNGEGSIYRRKADNKWVAELVIGWAQEQAEDGSTRAKKKVLRQVFDSHKKAKDWLADRIGEKEKGTLVLPSRQTLAQFLDHWLTKIVPHDTKASTVQNYTDLVRAYIVPVIGDVQISKLNAQHVDLLKDALLTSNPAPKARRETLSANTVQRTLAVLHVALQVAVDRQLLARNPVDAVKSPRVEKKDPTFLTPDQIERFLEAAAPERLHALWTVAVCTGLRLGELLGLSWERVDLAGRTLSVTEQWVKAGSRMIMDTPKTKKSRRIVPLIAPAVQALERWRFEQARERNKLQGAWQTNLVFTTSIGTPLNPSNLRNRDLPRILERAGLPPITPHALRHSCATWLDSLGVPTSVISSILGHSQISVTSNIYTHVFERQKKEAVDTLERYLTASREKKVHR